MVTKPRIIFVDFLNAISFYAGFFTTRLHFDFIEHVLTAQSFGYAFGLVLCQRMLGILAGDLEQAILKHHHPERAKGHAWRNLDFIHVVDFEVARLFDPVFNERVSKRMFGFRFREEGPLHDETIFAHFACLPDSESLGPAGLTITGNLPG